MERVSYTFLCIVPLSVREKSMETLSFILMLIRKEKYACKCSDKMFRLSIKRVYEKSFCKNGRTLLHDYE